MSSVHQQFDVVTPCELARAAGVAESDVLALVEAGAIRTVGAGAHVFVSHGEAVRVGRALVSGQSLLAGVSLAGSRRELFDAPATSAPTARTPFAVSSLLHASLVAGAVVVTSLGLGPAAPRADAHVDPTPLRMVYLALPGPGGGGGGGGVRAPKPAPKAERKGVSAMNNPLPKREPPPEPRPAEEPKEPEPIEPEVEPLPPIQAPVAPAPSSPQDRAGVIEDAPPRADSRGSGDGGGTGSGTGTGIGEGDGPGIGEGSGGGMGGGSFRPGSGVQPPSLVREVRPAYTEEARQRGIEGGVVMEIVVLRDGSVGDVRIVRALGHGLDQRAVQAVRQWRFSPGRRRGTPVDVMVEVEMEFRLR